MENKERTATQTVVASLLGGDTLELWISRARDPVTVRQRRVSEFLLVDRLLEKAGAISLSGLTSEVVARASVAAEAMGRMHVFALHQMILCAAALGKVSLDALPGDMIPPPASGSAGRLRSWFGDRAAARILLAHCGRGADDTRCNDPSLAWCRDAMVRFMDRQSHLSAGERFRVRKLCARLMAYLTFCHGVSSFGGIRPSHFAGFNHAANIRHEALPSATVRFIGFLVGEGLLGSHFLALRHASGLTVLVGAGEFDAGSFPPGHTGPAELHGCVPRALAAMEGLGYRSSSLERAMTGAEAFALFLAEHGLMASEEGARIWGKLVDRKAGKRLHLWTGAMVATLVAEGREVTPTAISDCLSRRRARPSGIPAWAAGTMERYGQWRASMGMGQWYRGSIVRLCRFLEGIGIRDFSKVTRQALVDFYAQDTHASPSGKQDACRAITNFLTYLAGEGIIRFSVAASMPSPSVKSVRPVRVLSRAQREAIVRFCGTAGGARGLRVRLALELALLMGLRASDICDLDIGGIDPDRMVIRLTQRKTGREVELPMPEPVLAAVCDYLDSWRQDFGSDRLMLSVNAPHAPIKVSPVHPADIARLGCDKFTMHDLRRTFATGLLEGGADFRGIAALLGHADTNTVHRYLSASERLLRECCLPFDDLGSEVL